MNFKVNKNGCMGGFWGRKNKGQMYYELKKNSVIVFLSTLEIKKIYIYIINQFICHLIALKILIFFFLY